MWYLFGHVTEIMIQCRIAGCLTEAMSVVWSFLHGVATVGDNKYIYINMQKYIYVIKKYWLSATTAIFISNINISSSFYIAAFLNQACCPTLGK